MCQYKPLDSEGIFEVLKNAPNCVLSVAENNQPYSVPINYQWKFEEGRLWFLVPSSEVGKKMNIIKGNRKVCLQFQHMDENIIETVVANGRIIRIEKDEIETEIGTETESGLVFIEILATNVSGRSYTINNNTEGECADVSM